MIKNWGDFFSLTISTFILTLCNPKKILIQIRDNYFFIVSFNRDKHLPLGCQPWKVALHNTHWRHKGLGIKLELQLSLLIIIMEKILLSIAGLIYRASWRASQ